MVLKFWKDELRVKTFLKSSETLLGIELTT